MKLFLGNCGIVFGVFMLTGFIAGFVQGSGLNGGFSTAEGGTRAATAAIELAMVAAFYAAGRRVKAGRARHLCWLAAVFWLVNSLCCVAMSLHQGGWPGAGAPFEGWAAGLLTQVFVDNLFFTLFCAGIGGVFSMATADHLQQQKRKNA